MKKTMVLACVLGLALGAQSKAADLEKAEAAFKDGIKLMKEATKVLKTMKDEETVKAAEPDLKKLGARAAGVFEKLGTIGKTLSKDEQAEIKKKFEEEVKAIRKSFGVEEKRVGELPGGKEALKLLKPQRSKPKPEPKDTKEDKKDK
jgi:cytochrome c556